MKKSRLLMLLLLFFAAVTVLAGKPAKYVFLMIGDGMGPEFCRLYFNQYPNSNFSKFTTRIPTGTNNVFGKTTDSAASGTALACGFKTYNGSIGMDKDGNPRSSLARLLQKRKWNIGIASSVGINDATPGAHYGNRVTRKDRSGVLADLVASNFNFFGVSFYLNPAPEFKKSDFLKALKRSGYNVATDKNFKALKPGKNVIFGKSEFSGKKAPEISLADITAKAAELLSADGKSFFLMVEGGAIDHCNHRNDSAWAIREMIEFDAAIGEALKFAEKHPEETLIIVTADHDTGGTKIMDISKAKKDFHLGQKKSFGELTDMAVKMKKAKAPAADIIRAITEGVGISDLTPEERARIEAACQSFLSGKKTKTDKFTASMGYGKYNPMVIEAMRIRDNRNGFTYTSFSHTPVKVITFVKGAGMEHFSAPQENSDIPHRIAAAAGFPGLLEKEGANPPFPVVGKEIADHVEVISVTVNSATVRYGFNRAQKRTFKLSNGAEKTVDDFFGRITFDNLKADTAYTLTLPAGQPIKFRTQKVVDGKLLFKVGVLSDTHISTFPGNGLRLHNSSVKNAGGLVEKFNKEKMDFILVSGDLTDKGRESEVEAAKAVFKNAKMPVFITRGNHDIVPNVKCETVGNPGKDFEYIYHHGVKFDQSGWIKNFGRPSGLVVKDGVQIAWVNTPFGIFDLPENVDVISKIDEKLPLIIFSHYQLIPDKHIAVKDKAATIGETRDKKSFTEAPEGARKLLEKLSRCKGLILVGHKNVATSVKLGSMTQINMPQTTQYATGGIALEVYDSGVRLTFVPAGDAFTEEYTRRATAISSSRMRHRIRYSLPVWNQFIKW